MNAPRTLVELTPATQWVAWRNEDRDGKPTKVPYAAPDRRAEANDPTTWLTHDNAAGLAKIIVNDRGGGVGIELGPCRDLWPGLWLAGVDLDTCRDLATGQIEPWAQAILDRLGTYYETSPSGTGVKAFLLIDPADITPLRSIMRTQHGRQFKRANGSAHPPAIELHVSNRYFAVTWETLENSPNRLRLVPLEDLRWLLEDVGPVFAGKVGADRANGDDTILTRLNRTAARNKAVDAALRNAATMKGGSRSEGPLGLGAALKRAGWSFDHMKAALLACPATKEWAAEKLGEGDRQFDRIWEKAAASNDAPDGEQPWPAPLDFLTDNDAAPPELHPDHVPTAIWMYATDAGERMGVDPTNLALGGLVSCASVISDEWHIQPKRYDTTWIEQARLWGAIVGDPGILKTPVIAACTRPIDRLDAEARERHQEEMRAYRAEMKAWKARVDDDSAPEPRRPKLTRYLVEGTTIEALSEVLRDDEEAYHHAPAQKVLVRHDEMAEFIANLDRYRAGGRGGGDRGAYLRLYNGGRHTIDRIGRGSFAVPNWSACLLGGIQPEPIQRIAKDSDDDGLLQRFAYCVPGARPPGVDRKPDPKALQRYEGLFTQLVALHPPRPPGGGHPGAVVLHEQAHQHRENIEALARAMAALPDTSPRLRAVFKKWPGLFARLCLTFHLIAIADARQTSTQGPFLEVVPEATARQVADFMHDILLPHLLRAERLMFGTAQTTHAQWIAGHILAHRLDRITTRDIVRAYRALAAPEARDELAAVMASMVAIAWLEPEAPNNPVKQVLAWRVNPAVHIAFEARAEREREQRDNAREQLAADIEVLRQRRSGAAG
jgi:hypothetical protein